MSQSLHEFAKLMTAHRCRFISDRSRRQDSIEIRSLKDEKKKRLNVEWKVRIRRDVTSVRLILLRNGNLLFSAKVC